MPQYCNLLSEPSPYAILLTCLQKNYGLCDTSITTSMTPARNQKNEFKMKVNQKEVETLDLKSLCFLFTQFLIEFFRQDFFKDSLGHGGEPCIFWFCVNFISEQLWL